jgi:hypothetical protein
LKNESISKLNILSGKFAGIAVIKKRETLKENLAKPKI